MKNFILIFFLLLFSFSAFSQVNVPVKVGENLYVTATKEDLSDKERYGQIIAFNNFMNEQKYWAEKKASKINELIQIQRNLNQIKAAQDTTLLIEDWPNFRTYSARKDSLHFNEFRPLNQLTYESSIILPGQNIDSLEIYLNQNGNGIARRKDSTSVVIPIGFEGDIFQIRFGSNAKPLPGETKPKIYSLKRKGNRFWIYHSIDELFRISTLRLKVKQ